MVENENESESIEEGKRCGKRGNEIIHTNGGDEKEDEKESGVEDMTKKKMKIINEEKTIENIPVVGDPIINHTFQISSDKVGQILGTKGVVISQLQNRSGCQILINQDLPPSVPRDVTLIGTSSQVQHALQMITAILEIGPAALHMLDGPIVSIEVTCSQQNIGRVIGSHGHTIKEIERQCGVKIQIDHFSGETVDRKIRIIGNSSSLQNAQNYLEYVIANGGLGPLAHTPTTTRMAPFQTTPAVTPIGTTTATAMTMTMTGGRPVASPISLLASQQTQIVECPKSCIGLIIGKGGETVNQLQLQTGTTIHIEQNVPAGHPCRIHVTGSTTSIEMAVIRLRDIASGNSRSTPKPVTTTRPVISLFPETMNSNQYSAATATATTTTTTTPRAMTGGGGGGEGSGRGGYPFSAPPPRSNVLPPHWTEHMTDDGYVYWYNALTATAQWERPTS